MVTRAGRILGDEQNKLDGRGELSCATTKSGEDRGRRRRTFKSVSTARADFYTGRSRVLRYTRPLRKSRWSSTRRIAVLRKGEKRVGGVHCTGRRRGGGGMGGENSFHEWGGTSDNGLVCPHGKGTKKGGKGSSSSRFFLVEE